MKADELFEIIGDISDEKIDEAAVFKKKAHRKILIRWGALAACFAIISAAGFSAMKNKESPDDVNVLPAQTESTQKSDTEQKDSEKNPDEGIQEENDDLKDNASENEIPTTELTGEVNIDNDSANIVYTEENEEKSVTETAFPDEKEYKEKQQESSAKEDASQSEDIKMSADVNDGEDKKNETEGSMNSSLNSPVSENFATSEPYDKSDSEEALKEKQPVSGGGSAGGGGAFSAMYNQDTQTDSYDKPVSEIFGGAYIDENGNYVAIITEDTPQNRETIVNEIITNADNIVFKKGKYTLTYLTDLHNKIVKAVANGEIQFITTATVVEKSNCIEVGVTTQDESALDRIRKLDSQGGAVVFILDSESSDGNKEK